MAIIHDIIMNYLCFFFIFVANFGDCKEVRRKTAEISKLTRHQLYSNVIKDMVPIVFIFLFPCYKGTIVEQIKHNGKGFYPNPYRSIDIPLNDYNSIHSYGCESESLNQGRSYENKNINISDCVFLRSSTYSGDGGVIYVSGGTYSMFVNYSMFYNCMCSGNGGAIHFSSSNSVVRMICAYKCYCGTNYYRNFAHFQASQVNQVDFLSLSYCSYTNLGYGSFWLYTGNQRVDNTNCSMNKAKRGSGMIITTPSSLTSIYCTFSNNIVSDYTCIEFYTKSGTISYANIVHNNSPSRGVVEVANTGSYKMYNCIFDNNQNTLFYVGSGSLEVSHSIISHSGAFSAATSVSTGNNNSLTKRQTYQIQFFYSYHCHADNPLLTSMSTNPILTPHQTLFPEQTPFDTHHPIHTPHQSLFPEQTPFDTHHPIHTPYQSLFSDQTPHQSLFPIHTPYDTHHPERTNQRSFPLSFVENTASKSYEQSNNSIDESKSNPVFIYSTVVLTIIILVVLSYNIGAQRNQNGKMSSSTSLEMKANTELNSKKEEMNSDIKKDHHRSHHEDYIPSPYVF